MCKISMLQFLTKLATLLFDNLTFFMDAVNKATLNIFLVL
jgi:hypothetical protein